jgi:hypothetical protein
MQRVDPLRRASIKVLIGFVAAVVSIACLVTSGEPRGTWSDRCGPLSESFDESDLIGTWKVTREPGLSSDVIMLREDRTYKQVLDRSDGEHYESPWNPWWLEHRESGGVYLHLEGMRYCSSIEEVCERPEGGGDDLLFWDFCEDRVLEMKREVPVLS